MWMSLWLAMGSGLALYGLLGLEWQHFGWSDLRTGALDHATGQAALVAATVTTVLWLLAVSPRRAGLRWFALVAACAQTGWMLAAPLFAEAGLQLMPLEQVQLVGGHDLALVGALMTLAGTVVLAGREPLPRSREPWLHVQTRWRDVPLEDRWVHPSTSLLVGQAPGTGGLTLPALNAPSRHAAVVPTPDGPALVAHPTGLTLMHGRRLTPSDGPQPILPNQSATLEWDDVSVECTLSPVPRPAGRSWLPDERLVAAIVVSALVQLLFIIYAVLGWQEDAQRQVATNHEKSTRVDAEVRQLYRPAASEQ